MNQTKDSSLLSHLAQVPDPRKDRQKKHQPVDILAIAILGSICGADTWTDRERFGEDKQDWLKTFLKLPNGIPSHDTFGRVFSLIDPKAFQAVFAAWAKTLRTLVSNEVISIDGKSLRGSHDKANGKAAIHSRWLPH